MNAENFILQNKYQGDARKKEKEEVEGEPPPPTGYDVPPEPAEPGGHSRRPIRHRHGTMGSNLRRSPPKAARGTAIPEKAPRVESLREG